MRETLLVAAFELRRHVMRRRFVVATVGLPLLILAMLAVALWVRGRLDGPELPWAIVGDGRLTGVEIRLGSLEEAEEAVRSGRIGGYVELRDEGRALARRGTQDLPPGLGLALYERAQDYVFSRAPEGVRATMRDPADLVYMSSQSSALPMAGTELFARTAGAIALPFAFALAVLFASSYLVQAVTEEKSNRIIEVLATSTSPSNLIAGKVLGLGAASVLQTSIWLAIGLGLALRFQSRLVVPGLGDIPWSAVIASVPFFLFGYVTYATMMVGIGVMMGEPREAQQVASVVSMFLIVPFALLLALMGRPSSPVAVLLSVFPLTSPVAMPMRLMLSAVPAESWLFGLIVLTLTTATLVSGVGGAFRRLMLASGERPTPRALLSMMRS